MKALELKIVKLDRAVVLQIIHMDESFRRKEEFGGLCRYSSDNGIIIISAEYPEICEDKVILWGTDKNKDHKLLTREFNDNEGRDSFIERLKSALLGWLKEHFEDMGIEGQCSSFSSDCGEILIFH